MHQLPGGSTGGESCEEKEGNQDSWLGELVDRFRQEHWCHPPSAVDSGQRSMDPGRHPTTTPRKAMAAFTSLEKQQAPAYEDNHWRWIVRAYEDSHWQGKTPAYEDNHWRWTVRPARTWPLWV